MSDTQTSLQSVGQQHSRSIDVLIWFGLGFLAAPVNIYFHELAHYLVGLGFGAKDLEFYAAAIDYDVSSLSNWQNGLLALAGILASWAMIALAFVYCRKTLRAFWATIGFISSIRMLSSIEVTWKWLRGQGINPNANFDENIVAQSFGFHPMLIISLGFVFLLVGAVYFGVRVWREKAWYYLPVMVGSFIAGAFSWLWVGGFLFAST